MIRISTRAALGLLVAAITIPLALFAALVLQRSAEAQRSLIDRQNVDLARAIGVAIDQQVQQSVSVLRAISTLDGDTADAQTVARFKQAAPTIVARQPSWVALSLLDPAGQRLAVATAADATNAALDVTTASRAVPDAIASGQVVISDLITDAPSHANVFLVVLPVTKDRAIHSVLVAEVSTQTLSDVLRRQNAPPNGVVTLIDRTYRIMARTRGEPGIIGQRPTQNFQDNAARTQQGSWRGTLLEGTPAYAALSRSAFTGWVLGVGMPAEAVEGPLRRSLMMMAGAGFVTIAIGLVAAVSLARLLIRALDDCAGAAEAFALEQPFAFRSSPVREVHRVANSMNAAIAQRERAVRDRDAAQVAGAEAARQRELALAAEQAARVASERNEARLAVTLRSIGDAVIATDASGAITIMNPVAQALTGWTEALALGQAIERVFDIFNEDTRKPVENPVSKVFAAGKVVGLANHTVLRTRDGREIPIEDSAAPIHGTDDALVGVVLVFRDCTSQREEERRRRALLIQEQKAREEAEAVSRAKDEFLATLSHELRTPLNAILGWAQMLRRGQVVTSGQARVLEIIERNARVQTQLVADLLDMSRIVRGQVQLNVRDVQLAPILDAVFDAVRPAAEAKEITLALHNDLIDQVSGDPARLQQVFWNLLTNSTKFTPKHGRIDVRLFREGSEAVAQVIDNGSGIAPDLLPHVFERFRQGADDRTEARSGLGIGLSLVRHLVELHGGTVTAQSGGSGQGATFTVRLPILGARSLMAADVTIAASAATTSVAPRGSLPLGNVRALIAADEEDSRELLAAALSQAGAECTVTTTAADALAFLEAQTFDVVIADLKIPGPEAYDLLKAVRADTRLAHLPVVALSAVPRSADYERDRGIYFDLYLMKPVEPQSLVQAVSAAVGH